MEGSRKMRIRKTNWIRNWILKRAVLGFAVAALIAPAGAQGARGGVVTEESTSATRLVGPHQQPALPCAPECEAEKLVPNSVLRDKAEPIRGPGHPNNQPNTVSRPEVVSPDGFDWGDAGIGASLAIGLALLGGTAFRASRPLRKPQTA